MSIVKISDFKKVYPNLWKKINEVRIESGNRPIYEEYSDNFSVPIKMYDASLAESYLQKNVNSKEILGYSNLKKIVSAVKNEPNMLRWLDVIYYKNNPRGLYSDRYLTEENNNKKRGKKVMADTNKTKTVVQNKEVILFVSSRLNSDSKVEYFTTDEAGNTVTDYDITKNQKKLKYAYENKGVVRGRFNSDGTITWRVVKEKFVIKNQSVSNDSAQHDMTMLSVSV